MGLKIAMSEGMIFEKLGNFFESKIDEGYKIYNLFFCQWCMATLCSIAAYFFAFGLDIIPFEWDNKLVIRWPLVICGASFVSGNVWNIYLTINKIRERNEIEWHYFDNLLNQSEENKN